MLWYKFCTEAITILTAFKVIGFILVCIFLFCGDERETTHNILFGPKRIFGHLFNSGFS